MPLFLPPDCPTRHMDEVQIERRVRQALPGGTPRAAAQAWFSKCRLKMNHADRDDSYGLLMPRISGSFIADRSITIRIFMRADRVADMTFEMMNTFL